jgi:Maleate cis-trans isomerase
MAIRIGHLYPSGGISDHEIPRMAPPDLRILTTRMPFRDTSRESDLALARDVESHAGLLADAKVALIAFNCTAASLMAGPGVLEARIEAATGIPAVTTIEGVMHGLAHFDARRVALFTAYRPEVVAEERRFLAGRGIEVVTEGHIPCLNPVEQGEIAPDRWLDLAKSVDTSGTDALLFSCAGIEISPVLDAIETIAGRPVVASNAALLRLVLNRIGWPDPVQGFGQLLAGP